MHVGCCFTRRVPSPLSSIQGAVLGLGLGLVLGLGVSLPALERQIVQNFDDQEDGVPPLGWTVGNQSGALGDWQVEAGELSIEGLGAGTGGGGREVWIWYDRQFSGDITIEWNMRWLAAPADGVGRHGGMSFFASFPGARGSRYFGMSGYTIDWIDRPTDHGVRLHKWLNGAETGLLQDGLFTEPDPPELWRVEIRGDLISIYLDDEFFQEIADTDFRSGYIGFYQWENNLHVHYDNLTITNPDLVVSRSIPDSLINGTSGTVTLNVLPYLAGNVTVKEDLPAGLTPSNPSNGGVVNGQVVEWNLGSISDEVNLSYTMAAAVTAVDTYLGGQATHNTTPYPIAGETTYRGSSFNEMGFIKLWNHLGPLAFRYPAVLNDHGAPGACDANGGVDLPLDWIVNEAGDVTEANVTPFPGLLTRPQYGGDGLPGGTGARAAGLTVAPGDNGRVVQDRFPVWKGSLSPVDTIDHASFFVHGFDAEDHLTLSSVWVTNTTGAQIDTMVGIASDDSIQIFLNDVDVTLGGVLACRGWDPANTEQNTFAVSLPPGESRLLVKVTDGCCGSGFRLRFQNPADPLGPGLLPPDILVSLESAQNPAPATASRDIAQDSYNQGDALDVSITVIARQAGAAVELREVLPAGASASAVSDGGTAAAGEVVWSLTNVSTKTVSYKLQPASCQSRVEFGQSTWKIGGVEGLIGGESSATRNPLADQPVANWQSVDVGTTGGAVVVLGEDSVTMTGTGGGIKLREDQFRFVHVASTGERELKARIDCFDDPSQLGQAGLMVRDTLDNFSAHVFFGLATDVTTGRMRLIGTTRRQTDPTRLSGNVVLASDQREVAELPIWLKIRRAEGKIILERSADDVTYTLVGSRVIGPGTTEVTLRDEALWGLAATAGGGGAVHATFAAVTPPSFVGGPKKPMLHRGDADQNAKLELTDAVRILGFLFLGGPPPSCMDAGDSDDNGLLQLTDAVRILGFLFLGQAPPAPPGPPSDPCGEDTTEDELDCAEYLPCAA